MSTDDLMSQFSNKRRESQKLSDAELIPDDGNEEDAIAPIKNTAAPVGASRSRPEQQRRVPARPASNTLAAGDESKFHRRIKTDGVLQHKSHVRRASLTQQTNEQVLKQLSSSLTTEQTEKYNQASSEYKLDRDLKRALAQLAEREEQCNEAVEIIGTLEGENEELIDENDTLKEEVARLTREIKILDQKLDMTQDLFQQEKVRYDEKMKSAESQLMAMQTEVYEKDAELQNMQTEIEEAQQKRLTLDRHVHSFDGTGADSETDLLTTEKERKLYEQFQQQRRENLALEQKLSKILPRLQSLPVFEQENARLQEEIANLQDLAQHDVINLSVQSKTMETELIKLATRNAQLEKEKEELQDLLEQRDYETHMLKSHLDFAKGGETTSSGQISRGQTDRDDGFGGDLADQLYDAHHREQEQRMLDEEYYEDQDQEQPDMEFEAAHTSAEAKQEEKKPVTPPPPAREVPDVLKEYLHLTATAVKMKFPNVQTIESNELIDKVKSYSYFDYYERMVTIMKHEERELKAKQKEARDAARGARQAQKGGLMSKIGSWWGSSSKQGGSNKPPGNRTSSPTKPRTNTDTVPSLASSSKSEKLKKSSNSGPGRSRGASASGVVVRQKFATMRQKQQQKKKAKEMAHQESFKAISPPVTEPEKASYNNVADLQS